MVGGIVGTKGQDSLPVIWDHCFPFVVGRRSRRRGDHGQGRGAISHHRALRPQPPQPSHLLNPLGSDPQTLRRVSAYPQRRWSCGSASGLPDLGFSRRSLRAGRGSRRPALPPPAAARALPVSSAPGLQGDLLKQSPLAALGGHSS